MSVRRLAEDSVQPQSFSFSSENEGWAEKTIRKYPEGRQQSAVIPLLMRAQEQEGWVTKAAIEHVAGRLSMPLIRVLEVATFYTQFQLAPVGTRAHIQVCGTTPCMLRGSDALKDVCKRRIHPDQFHANEDGTLSWEEVECLGACVNAPMVMIFKDTYEDLTPERLEEIIDAFAAGEGASVPVGPQIDRHLSAPIGGATTLNTFDDSADIGRAQASGPASGSSVTGEAAGVAPSEAARVDTYTEETDPTIKGPAPDSAKSSPAAEEAASADPATNGGGGTTGGTRQGETGAARKESDAEKSAVDGGDAPQAVAAAEGEPGGLLHEVPADADDLKVLNGVGPKIEAALNEIGVYRLSQVAGWTQAELAWVDKRLGLGGRAARDGWAEQARARLAEKGE
ncbi:NADH-quinone oxidoreductase subunit NuoE [Aureimonas altamirensis]|uniref:NADH-quinone oxidoreductase subunit NuoE n=1 Tax=Aureimonas altamirensis TaxID=370622 RepID=UPI002036BED6|nr:NADH-quinone oxidoreductase subunit NuoE [Aureimonas altamirensis]MCM2503569.1 NADH-quinone oxidoreductase subunit NuoE [Aureimonas altamirensis]